MQKGTLLAACNIFILIIRKEHVWIFSVTVYTESKARNSAKSYRQQ